MWKEGPLHYNKDEIELIRKSNENVVLRYLHNSQDTREIINKVELYYQAYKLSKNLHQKYGLSQNPGTNDYILVFSNNYLDYCCEKCGNEYRKDANDKQCMPCQQSKYNEDDAVFEWIPYSELINIKEIGNKCLTTAIWKEGPLHYNKDGKKLIRKSYEKVVLRYLHYSQDTREIINKVKSYLNNELSQIQNQSYRFYQIQVPHLNYGLSRNPDTNDYILIFSNIYLYYYCEKCGNKYEKNTNDKWCKSCQINHLKNNFKNWTSKNEVIDNFIQERQLNHNKNDIVFEWIPYSEFINIKEIGDKYLTTAIWKEGPLHYNKDENKLIRKSYEKVVLRYLHELQNTREIINKPIDYLKIHIKTMDYLKIQTQKIIF
ncbi:hypothetical protein C1646_378816 [Rhizophagus diaphanus]|nr:hypothetical protein C1646_378816 [Rhizophagus diaphanus] [Rhizophagus sp. MUCL 43196]